MDLKQKKIAVLKSNASSKVKLAAVKKLDNECQAKKNETIKAKINSSNASEDVKKAALKRLDNVGIGFGRNPLRGLGGKETFSGIPDAAKQYFQMFSESRMQAYRDGDDTVLKDVPEQYKKYVIKFFEGRGYKR